MPENGDASVTPNQPWTQDGTASVAPIAPFPDLQPRTMSIVDRSPDPFTVYQSQNPPGIAVVVRGNEPASTPATLPILTASGTTYRVTSDVFTEFPDGFVVWFLSA